MNFRSELIASVQNGKVKGARALHRAKERRARGAWLLEGPHLLDEAVEGRCRALDVFYTASWADAGGDDGGGRRALERLAQLQPWAHFYEVTERVMGALATSEHPQGVALVVQAPDGWKAARRSGGDWDAVWSGERPLVVVADAVQDPGNAGTIIRSAAAAGASGVVFTERSVDIGNPKVVRATAGAVFRLPVICGASAGDVLSEAARRGARVYVLDAAAERDYTECDFNDPAVFVVGNEAHGLCSEFRGSDVRRLEIPMGRGVESLNAGVAASIVLFEAARQRATAAAESRCPPLID